MQPDDDDQPTVVLDFASIKDQLNSEEDITENPDELFDTEKILEAEGLTPVIEEENLSAQTVRNIYLVNFQTNYFSENAEVFSEHDNIFILYELTDINQTLKDDPACTLVFYYNDAAKIVNQLSAQIKNKFPLTKTLILAKGLSAEKAQKHHMSKYGANLYLKVPFNKVQLKKCLDKLNES